MTAHLVISRQNGHYAQELGQWSPPSPPYAQVLCLYAEIWPLGQSPLWPN